MPLVPRRPWLLTAILSGVVALSGALLSPSQAAIDTTPPTLNTPIKSSWLLNSQFEAMGTPDCHIGVAGDGLAWARARQQFKWTGSDDSGSVAYSAVAHLDTEEDEGQFFNLGTTRTFNATTTNANQGCGGGGGYLSHWDITATDPSGNATTKRVRGGRFNLTQETGNADDSYDAIKPNIAYTGAWTNSSCACWSNGAVRRTSAAGAAATITVAMPGSMSAPVTHLGLVMHRGPDRGKFRVYVNGTLSATVDLYSATNAPTSIVWQATLNDTRSHTVRLVNAATAGRPRIDLDAILTN